MPAKPSKKGRKIGRNKTRCAKYRAEGRREKNKKRRLEKLFSNIVRKNSDKEYKRAGNILVKVK